MREQRANGNSVWRLTIRKNQTMYSYSLFPFQVCLAPLGNEDLQTVTELPVNPLHLTLF